MTHQTLQRPTEAFVDLDALEFNFLSSKSYIGTDLKYMAVVKADAYGHGMIACALRLEAAGADWFGVALPEEGVELRKAGIQRPILCLGSFWPGQEQIIVENELTPVVYDLKTSQELNTYAAATGKTIDIHIKVDTGMGRVGFPHRESSAFAAKLKDFKHLRVAGLLTHFAAADDPDQDEFTDLQISRFETVSDEFREAGHEIEVIDLANSPAAIRNPRSRGNMVRLGGSIYGLIDDILRPGTAKPKLNPVLTLRSRIAHIKNVSAGESLGYGRTFVTRRDSIIALVPIGYADGYPRGLSNIGKISIRGSLVPIVGRISMDWTLVDVTDIPVVSIDDQVLLIGGDIKAADLAADIGTIAYEITCGISKRVPRVYQ